MARCIYLDWKSGGYIGTSNDKYYCKISQKQLSENQVKYTCKPDRGEEYKNCQVYKNRR